MSKTGFCRIEKINVSTWVKFDRVARGMLNASVPLVVSCLIPSHKFALGSEKQVESLIWLSMLLKCKALSLRSIWNWPVRNNNGVILLCLDSSRGIRLCDARREYRHQCTLVEFCILHIGWVTAWQFFQGSSPSPADNSSTNKHSL